MKYKEKTIYINRAREAKKWRNYYFGYYLPMVEGGYMTKGEFNNLKYN